MRFAKQVLFTIFTAVLLTACGGEKPKTPEQIIEQANAYNNQQTQQELQYFREHTSYLYDSETKMCLMKFLAGGGDTQYGSVAPVPCLNVIEKLSEEHRKQYLVDDGR